MPQAETKAFLDDGPKQYFMLIDKSALTPIENVENKAAFCSLRHPLTDKKCIFLFTHSNQNVFEIHNFKEEFRSWLIDDSLVQDGSFLMTTPLDPLFLVLPYLQRAEKKTGKFMTLDHIIEDEEFPESRHLPESLTIKDLSHVSDVKESGDIQAYRYSEAKTVEWLKVKLNRLADVLCNNNVQVSEGIAQSKNFVKSKKNSSDASRTEYLTFAHGLLSDYINADLSEKLRISVGLEKPTETKIKSENEPPKKKIKVEPSSGPTEDYSKNNKSVEPAKTPKLTAAQKKLSQVDKSGMKSISSFFSPKAK